MVEDHKGAICPNCGHQMGWESDVMSEEVGYEKEGHVVSYYTCRHCGTTAEYVFEYEDVDDVEPEVDDNDNFDFE